MRPFFAVLALLLPVFSAAAQVEGDFGMTGVVIVGEGNKHSVARVFPHSPADDAGIKAGDTILAINGVDISDLGMNEFVEKMRGKPGSEIVVTVLSKETGVIFSFKLTRVPASDYGVANP